MIMEISGPLMGYHHETSLLDGHHDRFRALIIRPNLIAHCLDASTKEPHGGKTRDARHKKLVIMF